MLRLERTYVYEVENRWGRNLGYFPARPANVTFAYTVLGTFANGVCGYTENFTNQTVTTSRTITSSCDINVQNVTVSNNAILTLRAGVNINVQNVNVQNNARLILEVGAAGEVTFIGDLDLATGTELEIR